MKKMPSARDMKRNLKNRIKTDTFLQNNSATRLEKRHTHIRIYCYECQTLEKINPFFILFISMLYVMDLLMKNSSFSFGISRVFRFTFTNEFFIICLNHSSKFAIYFETVGSLFNVQRHIHHNSSYFSDYFFDGFAIIKYEKGFFFALLFSLFDLAIFSCYGKRVRFMFQLGK